MLKILLVEDDDNDAILIEHWLEKVATIIRVRRKEDFQKALETNTVDLVLADYQLGGFTAVDALKIVNAKWPHIPVVVVSGTITDVMGADLLEFDAADYILKDRPARIVWSVKKAYKDRRDQIQKLRNQRLENIGALAMGIIHDLNNVLAPVVAVFSLIEEDLTPEHKALVDSAKNSVMRGADMLKQILMFIRGMNGHFSQIKVWPILRQLSSFLKEVMPRDIAITTDIADKLPAIEGNATQIHQILLNFAVNARDAIMEAKKPNGVLHIVAKEVVLHNFQPFQSEDIISGNFLSIEFIDSGTGMSKEVMDRIFEPYFTTKPAESGTGLGLSTSIAIAKNHQGYIDVLSKEGQGSTFRLLVPVVSTIVATKAEELALNPMGKGETLLLVEDEQLFSEILRILLQNHNYKVITAANGAEALGIYLDPAIRIDLVVTDMNMPIMTGLELIPKLREKNPTARIICMTGTGSRGTDLVPLKLDATINKPCNTSQILTMIRAVLDDQKIP